MVVVMGSDSDFTGYYRTTQDLSNAPLHMNKDTTNIKKKYP